MLRSTTTRIIPLLMIVLLLGSCAAWTKAPQRFYLKSAEQSIHVIPDTAANDRKIVGPKREQKRRGTLYTAAPGPQPVELRETRSGERLRLTRKFNYFVREGAEMRNIRFAPYRTGQVDLLIGIPYANSHRFFTHDDTLEASSGFFGLSAELRVHFDAHWGLGLAGSASTDLMAPFLIPMEYTDVHAVTTAEMLDLTVSHITSYWELGCGPAFTRFDWREVPGLFDSTNVALRSSTNDAIGLCLKGAYRLAPGSSIGILYRPMFHDLDRNRYMYQHTAHIAVTFRL